MNVSNLIGSVVSMIVIATPALVFAQEPTPEPAGSSATGVLMQARLQANQGLLSGAGLSGGSGFLIGYQAPSLAVGLGLGFNRIGVSSTVNDTALSGSVFQIAPAVLIDIWQSADGRARANLLGSVGYGRASLSATALSEDCDFDPITGTEVCTTQSEEGSASATFIPITLGVGGDYFIGRNFSLGIEAGLQLAFVTGIEAETNGQSESLDASANWQSTYGLLRATFILGD